MKDLIQKAYKLGVCVVELARVMSPPPTSTNDCWWSICAYLNSLHNKTTLYIEWMLISRYGKHGDTVNPTDADWLLYQQERETADLEGEINTLKVYLKQAMESKKPEALRVTYAVIVCDAHK